MKTFEVIVTGVSVVVVEADSEAEAIAWARQGITAGDFEIEEMSVPRELTTPEMIASAKLHSNLVLSE